MGHLSKMVFGDVTGAVGHVVFKHRAGSNYIAMRAENKKSALILLSLHVVQSLPLQPK